jgi:hypothetical protein
MKTFRTAMGWPRPRFDENDQPHFLFIITPPYSGSTALSELLNSSHRTMILQPRGEGQWLVQGLCAADRWSPRKKVDYASVKAVWLRKYQEIKRLTQSIDVVIEKSPPNMMRLEMLASQFRDISFMANNRNPYANAASILYRRYRGATLDAASRMQVLSTLAQEWVIRSVQIHHLIERLGVPLLTYEDFCASPSSVIGKLRLPVGVTDSINPDACVKVKDYAAQPIIDQNAHQIARLTDGEIDHVSRVLRPHADLLACFGYRTLA